MVAMFFGLDVSYVVSEFNQNKKLKNQLGIVELFSSEQISEFFHDIMNNIGMNSLLNC